MAARTPRNDPATPDPQPEVAEPATPAWIRVRAKDGPKHEYDVAGASFDPDMHVAVKKAHWPDLHGPGAQPRPTLLHTDKAGSSGTTQNEES